MPVIDDGFVPHIVPKKLHPTEVFLPCHLGFPLKSSMRFGHEAGRGHSNPAAPALVGRRFTPELEHFFCQLRDPQHILSPSRWGVQA